MYLKEGMACNIYFFDRFKAPEDRLQKEECYYEAVMLRTFGEQSSLQLNDQSV